MKTMKNVWVYILVLGLVSCNQSIEDTTYRFTLIPSSYSGLDFENDLEEDFDNNHLQDDQFITGGGVAVGDINNDGLPDIYLTGNMVKDRLYLNQGNLEFKDITRSSGIVDDEIWSSGVTMGDVNNDGLLDIYVCKRSMGRVERNDTYNHLYINQGDLTFTEEAKDYFIADAGNSVQSTFLDFDQDGLLDLYLINQPPNLGNRRKKQVSSKNQPQSIKYTDKFYRNTGLGSFEEGIEHVFQGKNYAYGLGVVAGDLNNDRWPDLYVSNDFDKPDNVYINRKDTQFDDVTNQSVKHMSNFSMGLDIADYDNDGLLDIFVVDMVAEGHKRIKTFMGGMNPDDFWETVQKGFHYQYMYNTLQKNNGNTTFSEVAHLGGISSTDWSWGPLFADLDNDGWKDLFVTNGVHRNMRHGDLEQIYGTVLDSLEVVAKKEGKELNDLIDVMEFVRMAPNDPYANYVYKNNGDLTFSKKIEEWGMTQATYSNGSAYADLDADGDLDLVINNVNDEAFLYRNNTMEKNEGNYLRVQVVTHRNSPAMGARVELFRDGQFWQLQELANARGYMSKSEDILHFGVGSLSTIDSVVVSWTDGKTLSLRDVSANQLLTATPESAIKAKATEVEESPELFARAHRNYMINFKHQENAFDDYEKQILLPHKMSNFGPTIAVADVNGDRLEDFYVGGAINQAGGLYLQQRDGTFSRSEGNVWESDKGYEDMGAEFLDVDGDGDKDLYVVSGGNEFEAGSTNYQDRLYLNNGRGRFSKSQSRLPQMTESGSCVVPGDYDNDGDPDLFVGGRLVPWKYPFPSNSRILRNDGGKYVDVTADVAPDLLSIGLVTSAVWTDYDGDEQLDLAVTGEWMTINLFENDGGKFTNATIGSGLEEHTGWYYSLIAEDIDKDGDMDFVAGNLGLNYKYRASEEEPFLVYANDFDTNGNSDIILGYHEEDGIFPVRGRSCSSQQLPVVAEKFPTFEAFGDADINDIYGDDLETALHLEAKDFASSYIENVGNGQFEVHPLPSLAQVSSVNSIIAQDFTGDGNIDLLIAGNLYPVEIETPRNDAGTGLFLIGDGQGNFEPQSLEQSGFFAPHDVKEMEMIRVGRKNAVLVANNNFWVHAIEINPTPKVEGGIRLTGLD